MTCDQAIEIIKEILCQYTNDGIKNIAVCGNAGRENLEKTQALYKALCVLMFVKENHLLF